MGCSECGRTLATLPTDGFKIVLAGNPNCGKTATFNALTGLRQKTGNWPGVTVDRKEGTFEEGESRIGVVDLPGIYSLDSSSLDEEIARDYLLEHEADLVVNVVDASNLERNLYLTVQLLEMGTPVVVALNMMDVARSAGSEIDTSALSAKLGCPVIPIVAVEGSGIDDLKLAVASSPSQCGLGPLSVEYGDEIEHLVDELIALIDDGEIDSRWLALKLLEGDDKALALAGRRASARLDELKIGASEELDIRIASARFNRAHTVANSVTHHRAEGSRLRTDRIDRWVLSRRWGVPIFLLVMYSMFLFTIKAGGALIGIFDGVARAVFVDGFGTLLGRAGAPDWLVVLLADGAGGGVRVVATFVPIVGALYLFLSVIEDTGYMARAAFVMDRAMRSIGLPGKAFVPMIVGFGCNVPAVMATRTLADQRERKLTILVNPFMSCGARLPVYALFAAAFFPRNGQNVVFALYAIGILAAIATGKTMRRAIVPEGNEGFMMELPVYHRPTLRAVLLHTWDRVKVFVRSAGKVIVLMVLALSFLNSIGTDGSFGHENSESSVLSAASRSVTPLLAPMGIEKENWPATVGIVSGVLAKEVIVGSLDSLYSELAADEGAERGTLEAMETRFDGRIGAFAYLLFVLLYFPCVATIGAIAGEAGRAWAAFVAVWTTAMAYYVSVTFYQLATFSRHPASSVAWVLGLSLAALVVVARLRRWANTGDSV